MEMEGREGMRNRRQRAGIGIIKKVQIRMRIGVIKEIVIVIDLKKTGSDHDAEMIEGEHSLID